MPVYTQLPVVWWVSDTESNGQRGIADSAADRRPKLSEPRVGPDFPRQWGVAYIGTEWIAPGNHLCCHIQNAFRAGQIAGGEAH